MSAKHERAARTVLSVVPLVTRTISSEIRHSEHALRPAHFGVLFVLLKGPFNLTDLAAQLSVSAPTMSNSISILEQRGWVERVRDAQDRRKVLVGLSATGHKQVTAMYREAVALLTKSLETLSDEQCDTVMAGLTLLRDSLLTTIDTEGFLLSGLVDEIRREENPDRNSA